MGNETRLTLGINQRGGKVTTYAQITALHNAILRQFPQKRPVLSSNLWTRHLILNVRGSFVVIECMFPSHCASSPAIFYVVWVDWTLRFLRHSGLVHLTNRQPALQTRANLGPVSLTVVDGK